MTDYTPIQPYSPDDLGARTTAASRSTVDPFAATSYFASLVGPAAVATAAYRNPGSADVVAAAVNATAGGMYGASAMAGGSPSALSYGGGVSALHYPGHPGTDGGGGAADMMAMAQQQLADSQSSSMAMLMIQDEMGQQNKFHTSVSNLMNSRDTLLATIIRNFKPV